MISPLGHITGRSGAFLAAWTGSNFKKPAELLAEEFRLSRLIYGKMRLTPRDRPRTRVPNLIQYRNGLVRTLKAMVGNM